MFVARRVLSRTAGSQLFRSFARDRHVQVEVMPSGVAVVRMDVQGEKQNTFSEEFYQDMEKMVQQVEADANIKSVVLASAKPGSWIAGANIKQIEEIKSEDEASGLVTQGQAVMNRVADMQAKKPWIAAINGACLGGGLEMAMTCTQRIASSSSKTVLGVPEVMLGLLPGWGGTQRLPKIVGASNALDMMLTGKMLKPPRAKKMGLVDLVVDPNALERTAIAQAEQFAAGTLKPKARKLGWMDWFLEKTPVGRHLMFKKATETVMKQTKGKYPAPLKILDCARAGLESGHAAGSAKEAELFGKLSQTAESKSLRGLFYGQTECKKNTFGKPAVDVQTIGVLGAGLMGAGIAQCSATKDFRVLLKDRDTTGLNKGQNYISGNLGKKLKKKRMTLFDHDATLANVVGLTDSDGSWTRHFANADLVVEAVFEELGVKHKVVEQMEAVCPEHCIIATNTSTLPIGDIASKAKRPENIVGMHYFSPAEVMQLLEVIPHAKTSKEVTSAAVDVGIRQGKTVITVKDVPGFYVNRSLGPMAVETLACVQQGVDPIKLNQAKMDFGWPVGPISLLDEVGIDVTTHVLKNLLGEQPRYLGLRMDGADLGIMDDFVAAGLLGKKSGKGFFDHSVKAKGPKPVHPEAAKILAKYQHPTKDSSKVPMDQIVERIALRFCVETMYCLQDGIISSAREGDIGAVFGIGFPPFRGGPFMWMDAVGLPTIVEKLQALEKEHGPHFAPPQILLDKAAKGETFHD
jgi:enoyl-CoA hydratase/long-chain 3-hydroxyacyl-CoA dehydrogenase